MEMLKVRAHPKETFPTRRNQSGCRAPHSTSETCHGPGGVSRLRSNEDMRTQQHYDGNAGKDICNRPAYHLVAANLINVRPLVVSIIDFA
jgi:hypothetical protein